ncbi:MAG: DUF4276 family protein [Methylomonas sp.]|nr:DUF4276 family protein [Methylomonas sp.]PPD22896.1 MAG: hypothetical protein CTY23_00830 [Methylomonas sp.]PPD27382.1 MAG: hypothetical protein CTY22_02095 [Methylomonas sp.]PPD39358.1 MAG: hypothetical protein CTY21_02090 [Methylomonas sp.]PPD41981.1 MAG: hypothetical protein CTY17_02665 [Methylomonas sp.]
MTRLLMLVEGQSEEIFVNRTLKPYLAERGVFIEGPIVLWTKRLPSGGGYRGGVSSWKKIQDNLRPLTKDGNAWVTTLLDFYGLPEDVPGFQAARGPGNPRDNVLALQERLAVEINHPRLIPFLALHEFEAWVFCAPDVVATHFDLPTVAQKVQQAIAHAGEPELINHGETTHPKARLKAMVKSYKETSDGPTLMDKIGIPAIRVACPHFAGWLQRLEALGRDAQ